MPKKRILFLYNGGTIGQKHVVKEGQLILVPPKDGREFQQVVEPIINKFSKKMDVKFELVTTKDSSNMSPNDWEKLIFRIKRAQEIEKFDGVAIAHGTDTLEFTSTALALALHGPKKTGLRIPICLTGAQTPIYQEGGDGKFNLENLFLTIDEAIQKGVADVMVNFWNRVLLGCRTIKVSEKDFDAMHSPTYPDVGTIDANGVQIDRKLVRLRENAQQKLTIAPKFGAGVVSIVTTPGTAPDMILGFITSGRVSAVIFRSLGEGNVCSEGEFSLIPVIKHATREHAIPIFITTKHTGGYASSSHYDTGFKAIRAGAISCLDHTDAAVDVKVKWLIGNRLCRDIEAFRKAMRTSFAGEVTEPK